MKYILVTGGVISGIGKGVISSSIGALLKGCGLHVTSIKIDPYLNIDAGTFSPYEHGNAISLFYFDCQMSYCERLLASTCFARAKKESRHFIRAYVSLCKTRFWNCDLVWKILANKAL